MCPHWKIEKDHDNINCSGGNCAHCGWNSDTPEGRRLHTERVRKAIVVYHERRRQRLMPPTIYCDRP